MNTRSGSDESVSVVDVDIAELEGRLHELVDQFVERSLVAGPDAIELLQQGTALRKAAFILRTARSSEGIDLRGDS